MVSQGMPMSLNLLWLLSRSGLGLESGRVSGGGRWKAMAVVEEEEGDGEGDEDDDEEEQNEENEEEEEESDDAN